MKSNKSCLDCRYGRKDWIHIECAHPKCISPDWKKGSLATAFIARFENGACGPGAKLFEPLRPHMHAWWQFWLPRGGKGFKS